MNKVQQLFFPRPASKNNHNSTYRSWALSPMVNFQSAMQTIHLKDPLKLKRHCTLVQKLNHTWEIQIFKIYHTFWIKHVCNLKALYFFFLVTKHYYKQVKPSQEVCNSVALPSFSHEKNLGSKAPPPLVGKKLVKPNPS